MFGRSGTSGEVHLSSAWALKAVGESNRVSSISSVESGMAQRRRSTGIIEIRSLELENVFTMPATGQQTEVVPLLP